MGDGVGNVTPTEVLEADEEKNKGPKAGSKEQKDFHEETFPSLVQIPDSGRAVCRYGGFSSVGPLFAAWHQRATTRNEKPARSAMWQEEFQRGCSGGLECFDRMAFPRTGWISWVEQSLTTDQQHEHMKC